MKKILFCLQTMTLGGVEKELITIMKRMSPGEYDITLLLLYISDTDIMKQIPKYVRIISLDIDKDYYCSSCITLCKQRMKKGKIIEAGMLLVKRIFGIGMTHANTNISNIPTCDEYYDIVICYHMHSPLTLRYVAEKTKADKKIAWIHNDFSNTGFPVNRLNRYLNSYQEIISVSHQVEREFIQLCPEYREKLDMCHNIVDEKEIIQKADENIIDSVFTREKTPKLLTIGRFTTQKGFDVAIKAAQVLKHMNIDFKWFFIGWGEQETEYRKLITECNVEDRVIILGRKNNPYPYIKSCDIYIQPSRHEAYGIVVHEAKVLHKPIICSRFAGAEEQIINGKTGRIVSVGNVSELAEVIRELLTDAQLINKFVKELREEMTKTDGWDKIKKHLENDSVF